MTNATAPKRQMFPDFNIERKRQTIRLLTKRCLLPCQLTRLRLTRLHPLLK
jgi:hypothetical protein